MFYLLRNIIFKGGCHGMIFLKNPQKKMFSTIARIVEMEEGRGKAFGHKMSVTLEYLFREKKQTIMVDFWNAPQKSMPQLYNRVQRCSIGDIITITIRKGKDNSNYAVNFAQANDFVRLSEDQYLYFGKILHIDKAKQNGKCLVRFGIENKQRPDRTIEQQWNHFIFTVQNPKEFSAKVGDPILAIGNNPVEQLLPNGAPVLSFTGSHYMIPTKDIGVLLGKIPAEEKKSEKKELKTDLPDTPISIGVYRKNPTTIRKIFESLNESSDEKKTRALAWLSYVADEWEPEAGNQEFTKQKKAIADLLNYVNSKAS